MKEVLILKEPLNKVSNAGDLFNKVKKVKIDYEQENFILICLNSCNQVIKSKVLFKGGLGECAIYQNVLFREALLNNSNSLIIAHNHPTGNLNPSECDKKVFDKLKEAGKILKISVLDSIIFNKKEFYSLNNEVEK